MKKDGADCWMDKTSQRLSNVIDTAICEFAEGLEPIWKLSRRRGRVKNFPRDHILNRDFFISSPQTPGSVGLVESAVCNHTVHLKDQFLVERPLLPVGDTLHRQIVV